jgi:signal peptidase I
MPSTKKKQQKPKGTPKSQGTVAALRQGAPTGKRRATLWENVKGIGGAVILFLVLRTFLIEAYRIPSPSMVPALLVGDWLFVNKLVYGPHIPFTNINLPGYSEPRRFDIAVFVSPNQVDQPEDPTPTLVKRIVGLPGDTLHMRDAKLFVNLSPSQTMFSGCRNLPSGAMPFFNHSHWARLMSSTGPASSPQTAASTMP